MTFVDINMHAHDIILKNNVFVPEICKQAFMRNKNIVEIENFSVENYDYVFIEYNFL